MKHFFLFTTLLFLSFNTKAQTAIKGNMATALVAIPNFAIEFQHKEKTSFQIETTASFWESIKGSPVQFMLLFGEYRYYTKTYGDGFFAGVNVGGSSFNVRKWNYVDTDLIQRGFGLMAGLTVGYQYVINDKFNIEVSLGGGYHEGFYKGYNTETGERYDPATNWNKSSESLPYKGGVMLVYKL